MQRWIVAALGLLVVVLAVFFLTEQTGDQGDPNQEAQAVADSQEAETSGETPESSQPEDTQAAAASDSQAVDDQADAVEADADQAEAEDSASEDSASTGAGETDASASESEGGTTTAADTDTSAAGSDSQADEGAADEGAGRDIAATTEEASEQEQVETAPDGATSDETASDETTSDGTEQSGSVSVAIEDQTSETDGQQPADGAAVEEAGDKDAQIAALPDSREVPPSVRPSFDIVRIEGNGEAVLAGRAEPGSDVTLYAGDANLASVVADGNGNWVLLPDRPLPAGSHELTLRSRSPDGTETESADAVIVVVPEAPRVVAQETTGQDEGTDAATGEDLTFDQADDGQQEAGDDAASSDALAVLVPREGEGASQVLQQPDGEGIQDDQLVLLAVDYDSNGRIVISGRAAPGARVVAYLDDKAVGQSAANESGRWVVSPSETVAPGLHRLRIDQIDASGNVVARVETPFSRAQMLTALPDERFVIVQPGNSLWRIARRTYGDGFRYSVIYQSNAEQIRDPDLIYPGQIFMLPQDAAETN